MFQNNRTICFGIVLFMLSATFCRGQTLSSKSDGKSFYFAFGAGYAFTGFGLSNAFGVDNTTVRDRNNNRYFGKPVHGSLAKGFDVGIQMGYKVNSYWGLELGLSSLVRGNYGATDKFIDSTGLASVYGENYHLTLLRFCPAIRLELTDNRFHPYTRTGLMIGIPMFARYQFVSSNADTIEYTTYKLSGRLSWGFLAAIGARYNLNGRISLTAELCGILESWAPGKASMTSDLKNGIDQMWLRTEYEKEIIFSRAYSPAVSGSAGNYTVDTSKPENRSKNYLPLSSLEIKLGLHLILGK